tara:strand:+ start:52 stop:855 length:804 start_codon:yes stop_codon:yes gene_type:complete
MLPRIFVDADGPAFMACVAYEKDVLLWGNFVREQSEVERRLEVCKAKAVDIINTWVDMLTPIRAAGTAKVILCFTGPDNFRTKILPEYKANRAAEKPDHYTEVVSHLKQSYSYIEASVLEADDLLGIYGSSPDDWIISPDKDMKTLAANFFHIRKAKEPDVYPADQERADYWWMHQTITGDSVDGYKGAPGAGTKAADNALRGLTNLSEMWTAVTQVYETQYHKYKQREKFVTHSAYTEALMNARCARILRPGDYNENTGEVKLWTP